MKEGVETHSRAPSIASESELQIKRLHSRTTRYARYLSRVAPHDSASQQERDQSPMNEVSMSGNKTSYQVPVGDITVLSSQLRKVIVLRGVAIFPTPAPGMTKRVRAGYLELEVRFLALGRSFQLPSAGTDSIIERLRARGKYEERLE